MKKYLIYSAFYEIGVYEAATEQEAKDLCAIDAGYLSEQDMLSRLELPCNDLLVKKLECPL
jgi:hypothetical protein